MKTHIMFRRVLTALAFAAVLALPPGPAQAQTNDAPQPKKEDPSAADPRKPQAAEAARDRALAQATYEQAKAQSPAPVQYDLEIENGALRLRQPGNQKGEYAQEAPQLGRIVKLLRDKHPEANIALAPELEEVGIADLKLHAAAVEEELEALRVASGGKFNWRAAHVRNDSVTPLFALEPSEKFWSERAENMAPQPPSPPRQVEVFNFSPYFVHLRNSQPMEDAKFEAFKEQTIETTREIIERTIKSLGTGPIQFQFHQGANLLVVTGPPDAIDVARKVINAMIGQPTGDVTDPSGRNRFYNVPLAPERRIIEDLTNLYGPGQRRTTRPAPTPQPYGMPVPAPPGYAPVNPTNQF